MRYHQFLSVLIAPPVTSIILPQLLISDCIDASTSIGFVANCIRSQLSTYENTTSVKTCLEIAETIDAAKPREWSTLNITELRADQIS